MSSNKPKRIINYIWGIADDVLRDLYARGKYRDVILSMTVLRRLDAVLEDNKQAVLSVKATLDEAGVVEQDPALRQAADQAFDNTSKFTMRDLKSRASRCPTPPTLGTSRTPSRSATRSVSSTISKNHSQCATSRRSAPASWH